MFDRPVGIYRANDLSNRLFVIAQKGEIYVFEKSKETLTADVFLDMPYLGRLFLLSTKRIEKLLSLLVEKDIVRLKKVGGFHQYPINPNYIGKPLALLKNTVINS